MTLRATLALGTALLSALPCGAAIGIGDSRDEVMRQLGKPTSIARRGEHEIFLYPKGGRIELVGGKVSDVKGPLPTSATAGSADAPAPRTPSASEGPQTKSSGAHQPRSQEDAPPLENDYNPAIAANELAKHVEKMDTAWGASPPGSDVHSPLEAWPEFLTGLLLRFTFTIVALKLAFKYWEMDAFWMGVLLIAGVDLILHAIFELLGPASGGFTTLLAVENGVPGLVMIFTIHRFCFNKRIQHAVLTAAAVKVVATMLYIFAGVAMLNLAYG